MIWLWHHGYHVVAWTWGGTPFRSGATGYNIISGDVSDIGLLAAIGIFLRRHNCHRQKCWRLAWHPDKDGHPTCRHHHPQGSGV